MFQLYCYENRKFEFLIIILRYDENAGFSMYKIAFVYDFYSINPIGNLV